MDWETEINHEAYGNVSTAMTTTKSQQTIEEIGGSKGHLKETIHGRVLDLYRAFRWKPLPNCTGRYTCRDHAKVSHLTPLELLTAAEIQTDNLYQYMVQRSPQRKDSILIVPLDDAQQTGVITYVKQPTPSSEYSDEPRINSIGQEDSWRFIHTLNAPSGFQRKLNAIGIDVSSLVAETCVTHTNI